MVDGVPNAKTDAELWATEGGSVESAIGTDGKTKLVWIETPANPTWDVTDIERVCTRARAFGASVCVDATVLTPLCCKPIDLGADFVMHSATKYLNGHSDVVAGAIVAAVDDDRWRAVKTARAMNGGILGSFEAWLLLRGMRTLHVRMKRQCESAVVFGEKIERTQKRERLSVPRASLAPETRRRRAPEHRRRVLRGHDGDQGEGRRRGGEACMRSV